MGANINLLWKWWKTWRTFPVIPWIQAASCYRNGNFELAQKHYESGLRKHADHPAQFCARLDLSYCLFKNRKFEESEKHLKLVIANLPTFKEAHLRLARLQIWTGRSLEAAWTIRRAMREIDGDTELVATFMLAILDNEGPTYLIKEALAAWAKLSIEDKQNPKLQAARARFAMLKGDVERGRSVLSEIAKRHDAPIEAVVLFAQVLLEEGKIAHCRHELRKALALESDNPRVLSLFAESYLRSGPFYNPEYARQLGTSSCQAANWSSPREMHILAESFYHSGDKISALIIASKARQAGSRLLGEYRDVRNLDRLIESLSQGTQA